MKADGSSIRLFSHNHHFKSLKRTRKSSKESKSGEIAKSNPLLEAKLSSKFQHSTPNMHRSAFIKSVLNRVPIRSQLAPGFDLTITVGRHRHDKYNNQVFR